MKFLKKIIKDMWLFLTCGYGGLYWKDEIKEIEKKFDEELKVKQ